MHVGPGFQSGRRSTAGSAVGVVGLPHRASPAAQVGRGHPGVSALTGAIVPAVVVLQVVLGEVGSVSRADAGFEGTICGEGPTGATASLIPDWRHLAAGGPQVIAGGCSIQGPEYGRARDVVAVHRWRDVALAMPAVAGHRLAATGFLRSDESLERGAQGGGGRFGKRGTADQREPESDEDKKGDPGRLTPTAQRGDLLSPGDPPRVAGNATWFPAASLHYATNPQIRPYFAETEAQSQLMAPYNAGSRRSMASVSAGIRSYRGVRPALAVSRKAGAPGIPATRALSAPVSR